MGFGWAVRLLERPTCGLSCLDRQRERSAEQTQRHQPPSRQGTHRIRSPLYLFGAAPGWPRTLAQTAGPGSPQGPPCRHRSGRRSAGPEVRRRRRMGRRRGPWPPWPRRPGRIWLPALSSRRMPRTAWGSPPSRVRPPLYAHRRGSARGRPARPGASAPPAAPGRPTLVQWGPLGRCSPIPTRRLAADSGRVHGLKRGRVGQRSHDTITGHVPGWWRLVRHCV